MENDDKEQMEQNNLSKLSLHLKSILNNKIYDSDKDIINQTYNLVNKLLENKNCVNDEILDLIEKNIDYLYMKYEDLDYLVNIYVSVYSYYKKIVRKKYVDGLRKINREMRKKNEKNE